MVIDGYSIGDYSVVSHWWLFYLTRSQLLEGPKCESQTEDNGKARRRGTLPSSQHFKGVKGGECARALGWD
jgi:hypothetical protein